MSNVTIRAVLMWAHLEKENEMSGKFQVDLTQLSDGAVEALEDMGITVNFNDEKQHFVTCKSTRPIKARDADGASLAGVLVGNGSQAVAKVGPYEWKFKNKVGVSPSLNKLTVTDLEEYVGDEDGDEDNYDEAL